MLMRDADADGDATMMGRETKFLELPCDQGLAFGKLRASC
jgi:hypothetical protein